VCLNLNAVAAHARLDPNLKLRNGDLLNIDVSVYLDGYFGDLAETLAVGNISNADQRLRSATSDALDAAVALCHPGQLYRRLGDCIEEVAKKAGCSILRCFSGHGIGKQFHHLPVVPNFAGNDALGAMAPGHVFTIEPLLVADGSGHHKTLSDGSFVSESGAKTAQFEQMVSITPNGCEVLTARQPQMLSETAAATGAAARR